MAPFELLLLSALVAISVAAPTASPASSFRGLISKSSLEPKRGQHALDGFEQDLTSNYQCFHDPDVDLSPQTWLSFANMWRINEPTILSKNGGDTYIKHYIHEAVAYVADESAVDARLILALMMQEMTRDGIERNDKDLPLDGDEGYLSDVANRLLGWDGRGAGFAQCTG
ncbi:hypothetical protein LTR08_003837 [Meristemomyces frigidus]|nr:hypothetical protein LTR08_003837 [Meristemomyces frigidus]